MARKAISIPMTSSARNSLIAICILWLISATIVIFRLLGRRRGRGIGTDDGLSFIALILSGSTIGLLAAVFTTGVGYDFEPNSQVFKALLHNMEFIMQITFAFTLIYIWCLAALKMSQLAFYMRVFALQLRKWVYGIGAIVIVWALAFNFLFIFMCDPIAQQWTTDRIGHCIDQVLLLKCLIMTNLFTDLFIVILPMRSIWQLRMRKTEKLAVFACFGLGLACVFISLARFNLLGNLTGTSLTAFTLCSMELMLAGLCINIPLLRPFYLRWREKCKSSQANSSGRKTSLNLSRKGKLELDKKRPGFYTAWIELNDPNLTSCIHEDGATASRFTLEPPNDGIRVSRECSVTHT